MSKFILVERIMACNERQMVLLNVSNVFEFHACPENPKKHTTVMWSEGHGPKGHALNFWYTINMPLKKLAKLLDA